MKILFALHPEKGHVNPMIGTAQALADFRHQVSVVATGDIRMQIEAAGLEFHNDLVSAGHHGPQGKELVEFMKDRSNMIQFLEVGFVKMAERHIENFVSFFRRIKPELLIIDPMNYAAIIAAEVCGTPWVGLSSSLTSVLPDGLNSEILKLVDLLGPKRADLFKSFGVAARFRAVDCLSPTLNISFATEEFVGTPVDDVKLVGPALPVRSRGDLGESLRAISNKGAPVVYASFGSQLYHQPELFQKIIEAGQRAEVSLCLAIGDLMDDPEWQVEFANCQFYRYAPQMEILRKADLFITHGGANSITESLASKVPVLISPMCNDQEHQAYFVEKAGTGRTIDLHRIPVSDLSRAIKDVIQDERIRANVQRIGQSYQKNGSIKAAQWIQKVASDLQRRTTRLNQISSPKRVDFAVQPDLP